MFLKGAALLLLLLLINVALCAEDFYKVTASDYITEDMR